MYSRLLLLLLFLFMFFFSAEAERPARQVFPVSDLVRSEVHPFRLGAAPGLEALQHLAQHGKPRVT